MRKRKFLETISPYVVFVVAVFCGCETVEAVTMMLLTETILIKDNLRRMKKALVELADSTKAE